MLKNNRFQNQFYRPSRTIYYLNRINPALTNPETQEWQKTVTAEMSSLREKELHSLTLQGSLELRNEILGIRDDLAHTIPQMVDYNINELLRAQVEKERFPGETQRQRRRRLRGHKSFLQRAQKILYRNHQDSLDAQVDMLYGVGNTIPQRKLNLAYNIWNALDIGEQNILAGLLNIRGIEPAEPAPPAAPMPISVLQLANARSTEIDYIRANSGINHVGVLTPVPNTVVLPNENASRPPNMVDRLVHLNNAQNELTERRFFGYIKDPTVMQNFLNSIRRDAPELRALIDEILVQHTLYRIENQPHNQALLYKMFVIFNTQRQTEGQEQEQGQDTLRRWLTQIRDAQPENENPPVQNENGEENSEAVQERNEQLNRINGYFDRLAETKTQLRQLYSQADQLGATLWDYGIERHRAQDALNAQLAGAGGAHPRAQNINIDNSHIRDITKLITDAKKQRNELLGQIRDSENNFHELRQDIVELLRSRRATFDQPGHADNNEIEQLNDLRNTTATDVNSNENQIFGEINPADATAVRGNVGNSDFMNYINTLRDLQIDQMKDQVRTFFRGEVGGKKRMTAYQLLCQLNSLENHERGITNPELNMTVSIAQAERLAGRFKRGTELFHATNREISEAIGATDLQRINKEVRALFKRSNIYTADDLIEGITRQGSGIEKFKTINTTMTQKQLHVWLDENPEIDTKELLLFVQELIKSIQGFRYSGGKVEILDRMSVELEELIDGVIEPVLAARRAIKYMRGLELDPERNAMHQVTEGMTKLNEDTAEEEKSVLETVQDFVQDKWKWIKKKIWKRDMINEHFDTYTRLQKEAKENKMSRGARKRQMQDQFGEAASVLGAAYTAYEMLNTAKGVTGWMGRGVKNVSNRAASTRFMQWADRNKWWIATAPLWVAPYAVYKGGHSLAKGTWWLGKNTIGRATGAATKGIRSLFGKKTR
ncbi:hypothetical protein GF340_04790 [Candidatus Peregrinibacteria bacterium]|nr:hypothetical protein [Candidatus Peregrinibacteria bacterium]